MQTAKRPPNVGFKTDWGTKNHVHEVEVSSRIRICGVIKCCLSVSEPKRMLVPRTSSQAKCLTIHLQTLAFEGIRVVDEAGGVMRDEEEVSLLRRKLRFRVYWSVQLKAKSSGLGFNLGGLGSWWRNCSLHRVAHGSPGGKNRGCRSSTGLRLFCRASFGDVCIVCRARNRVCGA